MVHISFQIYNSKFIQFLSFSTTIFIQHNQFKITNVLNIKINIHFTFVINIQSIKETKRKIN